jgi:hypothetical protein
MNPSLIRAIAVSLILATGASCTTAYDAYGPPQQVVDPGAALLGVAAAGLIGFALADDHRGRNQYNRNNCGSGRWDRGYGRNQCQNAWY